MELANGMRLLESGDPGFEDSRSLWNARFDRSPDAVARCETVEDVVTAVRYATSEGLRLSVRGAGHSYAANSVSDGGLLIDLAPMKGVRVDPEARVANVQGGVTCGEMDSATQAYGLATPLPTVSSVGVIGAALGGGGGYLTRKFGLTLDNVISAQVVTAAGEIVVASDGENADLFWAIRGGGGNFGVVAEFAFALHPTTRKMLGGNIVWPVSKARDVLEFFAEYSTGVSEEMYVAPFMVAPPGTEGMVGIDVLYCGDPRAGEQELAPLRSFGQPLEDGVTMVDYLEYQTQFDGATAHGQRNYIKNGMVGEFTPGLIDGMIEGFALDPNTELFFHTAGGAVARIGDNETAFPHRQAETMIGIATTWTDPAEDEQRITELKRRWALVEPYTGGFYANLREEGASRTQKNFGPNYDRLVALKNAYDPGNLFRLNANVKPTV
jgi:hypothetical protein